MNIIKKAVLKAVSAVIGTLITFSGGAGSR